MSDDATLWRETGHVCRVCLGPVMARHGGAPLAKCMCCGAQVEGKVKDLCACGIRRVNGVDAGLRCVPNPLKCPESPQLVVVEFRDYPDKPRRPRASKPTDCVSAWQKNLLEHMEGT